MNTTKFHIRHGHSGRLSQRRVASGFTLIEILIVITVLVILISFLTTGTTGVRMRARRAKAQAQISQVATALEAYRNDFLEYPNDGSPVQYENSNAYILEQLSGKVMTTGAYSSTITGNAKWNGPYFDPKPEDVKVNGGNREWVDPWGNAYNLRAANDATLDTNAPKNNQLTFDIWSYGPDGANDSGTDAASGLLDDDIGNF